MNNKNLYKEGARYENEAKQLLESDGYDTVRSAGSHGDFDVWAANDKHLRRVQVKKNMSHAQKEAVLREYMGRLKLKSKDTIGLTEVWFRVAPYVFERYLISAYGSQNMGIVRMTLTKAQIENNLRKVGLKIW